MNLLAQIKTRWSLDKHKAWLVAKGYSQQEGFDYLDTLSLVIKITTVRILFTVAISKKEWHIHQLGVSNAFLHGDLTETIYMIQSQGFQNTFFPNYVYKLSKFIYGL